MVRVVLPSLELEGNEREGERLARAAHRKKLEEAGFTVEYEDENGR
jgi:hypothetical protein